MTKYKMLTRIILAILVCSIFYTCLVGIHKCSADSEQDLTVFASKEEQEAVCEALSPSKRACVVSGSVTPIYYISIYDSMRDKGFRNGDKIELSKTGESSDSFVYAVTLHNLTVPREAVAVSYVDDIPSEDVIVKSAVSFIEVKHGKMNEYLTTFNIGFETDYPDSVSVSFNYADFAEDMRVQMERDEVVDAKYVRLVYVESVGYCFYVNDGTDELFYRFSSWVGDTDVTHGTRILRVGEDLERAAREVKEYLERERKIQAGEIESGGSSSSDVETAAVEFHPATGDTSDIEAYLGVKIDSFKTHFPEAFKAPVVWPYFVAGGAAIVAAAAVAVVLIVKKRRNRAAGEMPAEAAV